MKTKTELKIEARIAKLSEKRIRKLLNEIVISYISGAAMQSDGDVAEFVGIDLKTVFRNIDKLIDDYEAENNTLLEEHSEEGAELGSRKPY